MRVGSCSWSTCNTSGVSARPESGAPLRHCAFLMSRPRRRKTKLLGFLDGRSKPGTRYSRCTDRIDKVKYLFTPAPASLRETLEYS
eukprot:6405450-Prymnesium_polylepis.1